MKKFFTLAALLTTFAVAMGDSLTVVLAGPDSYEVISVSKNGKYATLTSGSDGALWDLENNAVTYFTDADGNETFAYGVSNDGVVAGIFVFEGLDGTNGAAVSTGGVYNKGKYYPLLDENGSFTETTAMGISPDGKIVCGTINENSWSVYPALWNADGTFLRTLDTEDGNYGLAGYVTNDGVVAGWYYHQESSGRTNRQPCFWDADGVLHPVACNDDDVSGIYNFYGISGDGRYGIVTYGTENEDDDVWMKAVVYDLVADTAVFDCPTSSVYSIINGGIALGNVYSDDTGIADCEMIFATDSVLLIEDYITNAFESSLDADLDEHLFTAYMSDDALTICGTSYTADGSDIRATCWRRVDAIAEVRSLAASTLAGISDKAYLRWGQPLVNYDNLTNYTLYYLSSAGSWVKVTDIEGDLTTAVVSVPTDISGDSVTYKMTAVYDDEESAGVTASVAVTDLTAGYAAGPSDIYGYVYNYNDVSLTWTEAIGGASANAGWHTEALGSAFGATSAMIWQAAVEFDSEVIECYCEDFTLTGVRLYYNAPVDSLELLVYAGSEVLAKQTVDQSAFDYYSYNVITLDEAVTLPANAAVRVALRVVQTTTGAPLNLDGGPAVDGGDLISEDDGATWTTVRELSAGAYDYNWVIDMVLSAKEGDPTLTGYVVTRDSVQLATFEPSATLNYIDKGVDAGATHTYTISALWSDGSTGVSQDCSIYVGERSAERCPSPVGITAVADEEAQTLALTWEMPRQSELTYSNWDYSGTGVTITTYTAWQQGTLYDIPAMKPFVGGRITKVAFYPIADCDLAVHVYRDEEEVATMEITSYTIGQMNIVTLPEAAEIEEGYEYIVAIEGFDIADDTPFLGTDTGSGYGKNVYSYDDGETFYTDTEYTTANYMLGITIENDADNSDAGITYAVYIDSTKVADGLTEESYSGSTASTTESSVTVNVAAIYSVGESLSEDVAVQLSTSGISNVTADGSTSAATYYTIDGKRLNAPAGLYIERSNSGAKKIIAK